LELNPQHAEVHHDLGLVLLKQGKTEEAKEHFIAAIDIKPTFGAAHNQLGVILLNQGNLPGARTHLGQAVELDPGSYEAHYNLGMIFLRQHDLEEARKHYIIALKIKPDQENLLPQLALIDNALAWGLATKTDPRIRNGLRALALAQEACTATKYQQPEYLDTLAAAYAEAQRFDEAVKTAQKALSLASTSKQSELAQQIERRLLLYQKRQPYRED
jgi:Flp pilus assembly protein TadD